jgi:predicted metal-dependent hydrolase
MPPSAPTRDAKPDHGRLGGQLELPFFDPMVSPRQAAPGRLPESVPKRVPESGQKPGPGRDASSLMPAPSSGSQAPFPTMPPLPVKPASSAPATPAPPPGKAGEIMPDGSRRRTVRLGVHLLDYRLKRSARRTIGFTIDGTGLAVTAPRWVTLADIEAAIAEKQRWIFAKITEWKTRAEQRVLPQIDWADGAQLPYLGKTITVQIASTQGALAFDADTGILSLGLAATIDAQQIKDRVQGWLQSRAMALFGERIALYAPQLGVQCRAYALSSAASRWGSCSSAGKIRLNWRLIHFPLPIIDYVVAHELAHLREMNHGPRFWETVETVFPQFREARRTLKHYPPEALPIL